MGKLSSYVFGNVNTQDRPTSVNGKRFEGTLHQHWKKRKTWKWMAKNPFIDWVIRYIKISNVISIRKNIKAVIRFIKKSVLFGISSCVVPFGQFIHHLKAVGQLTLIISVWDQLHDITSFYRSMMQRDKLYLKLIHLKSTHQELSNEVKNIKICWCGLPTLL